MRQALIDGVRPGMEGMDVQEKEKGAPGARQG